MTYRPLQHAPAGAILTTFLVLVASLPSGFVPGPPARLAAAMIRPGALAAQDTTSIILQRRVYTTAPTRDGNRELLVDLYRPVEEPIRGAVVVMHGGGFTESYVDIGENKIYGQVLAQRGYLAAAISYRSAEDIPVLDGWAEGYARMVRELGDPRLEAAIEESGPAYPDAVAAGAVDLIAAVRWLREHAGELGFERERIALFGASSGSISSLTAAYAMELYGEENLDVAGVIDLRGLLLRADTAGNPFDPDEPPLLMLHGERDRGFPLPEVEAFFELAREAGTEVQLYTSAEHGHELGGRGLLELTVEGERSVLDHVDAFLESVFSGGGLSQGPQRGRLLPPGEPPGRPGRPGRPEEPAGGARASEDGAGPTPDPAAAADESGFRRTLMAAVNDLARSVETESDFLASLYGISKSGLLMRPFSDPDRLDWSYWPRKRAGLPLRHMTADQRTATHRILSTLLSAKGYLQVNHIMMLEEVLAHVETTGFARGAEEYTLAVFGEPSLATPWGLRFEGHHVSLNVTVAPERVSVTPSFLGASPAPLTSGVRAGFDPLRYEQRHALDLLESLDRDQRTKAILGPDPPSEILSTQFQVPRHRWDRWQERLSEEGVSTSTFDVRQKRLLRDLLNEIVSTYREEVSRDWLRALDPDSLTFAWMGEREMGRPHYFRIQGKRFVFELDAAQGDGTHVHMVWRDRSGDLGGDVLSRHYGTRAHSHPAPKRREGRDATPPVHM